MSETPERIWAFAPDIFDNLSVWQDAPSPAGDTIEYVRADRIEELEAKLAACEKYRDAYAECDRIGTQSVRELEAKLARAVEGLTKLEKSASNVSRYGAAKGPQWLKMSIDILAARTTLAELTGGRGE